MDEPRELRAVALIGPALDHADYEIAPLAHGSRVWRALRRDAAFWIGGAAAILIVALALLAPVVAPHDPNFQFRDGITRDGPVGPNAKFLLGTDPLGRDLLSRLLYGARTSLTAGLLANVIATVIGVAIGGVAAFGGSPLVGVRLGGRRFELAMPVESVLMRLTDLALAFPALLLAIALGAVLGPSLMLVSFVVAAILWSATARLVYGRVLIVKERDFVLAAAAVGVSPLRILVRHVMPHVLPIILVAAALGIAAAVLIESALSFLGVGVPLPSASWGSMIASHIGYYSSQPRLVILPGLAIMSTVLAFNLLGDALRDALDPHGWKS
jgi:peptide/nickel transport system permease protein